MLILSALFGVGGFIFTAFSWMLGIVGLVTGVPAIINILFEFFS